MTVGVEVVVVVVVVAGVVVGVGVMVGVGVVTFCRAWLLVCAWGIWDDG